MRIRFSNLLWTSVVVLELTNIPPTHVAAFSTYSISNTNSKTAIATRLSATSSTKDEITEVDNKRLQRLQQQATTNPLMSLNLNLDSLAQVGAASRAQELLQRIHALYQEGYYEVSPDVVSYNSVLKAWKEDDQPEKALQLLEAMIDSGEMEQMLDGESNNGQSNIHVDVISFNTVIAAFANQGNYQKSLLLLRQMQTDPRYPQS